MAKIKYYSIETIEGIEEFGAKLSNKDYRQGHSHSGNPRFTAWEDAGHKCLLRKERYATAKYVDACLLAEGNDEINDMLLLNERGRDMDEYNYEVQRYAWSHKNIPATQSLCDSNATKALLTLRESLAPAKECEEIPASNLVYNELTGEFEEVSDCKDTTIPDEDFTKSPVVYMHLRKMEPSGLCVNWEVTAVLGGMVACVLMCFLLLACK